MPFEKISGLLPTVKQRVKDGSAMEAAYVVEVAKQVFRNVYPEELWDLVRVTYFKNGVLTIAVGSSVVAHALKAHEKLFLSGVKRQTGIEVFSVRTSQL